MTEPNNLSGLPNPLLDPTNPASSFHRGEDIKDINHPLNPLNPNRLLAQETDRLLNGGLGTNAGTNLAAGTTQPLAETQAIGAAVGQMQPVEMQAVVGEVQPVGSEWIEPVKQIIAGSTEIVSPTKQIVRGWPN